MPTLPQFQSTDRVFQQLQSRWASIINPLILNPCNTPTLLKNVKLSSGPNTINHLLDRPLTAWKVIRQRSAASIYDNQDNNKTPELTLILVSSAAVSVDLEVY